MAESETQGGSPAAAAAPIDAAAQRAATRAAIMAGAAKPAGNSLAPAAAPAPAAPDAAAEPAEPAVAAAKPADEANPAGQDAVRKLEQHMRRQLAQERTEMRVEFERERELYKRQIEELTGFKSKVESSKGDSVGLLKALGMTEDQFEAFAFDVYANSPKGQKDPRFKERAASLRGQHEQQSTMEQLKAKLDALEQGLSAKDQAAQQQARAESYMARVTGAVTDETPLAKAALAKNPDKTTARLFEIAIALYQASGESDELREDPTAAQVLAAYDKLRAAELEELGIDPKVIIPAKPAAKPAIAVKPADPAAPTDTAPPKKKTRAELLEGIRLEREARRAAT